MTPEQRQEQMTEARLFYLAAPVIVPLIEKRRKFAFNQLMQAHRSGRTDTATIVAELSVLNDLENEIHQKEQTYKFMEEVNGKSK